MPLAQSQIFLALACHSLYSGSTVNVDRTFGEVNLMKVCENCGCEISTRDGENQCTHCENAISEKRRRKRRMARKTREDALNSLGLTKVRGALGGTYWE
jgi:hypothetical protein